MDINNSTIQQLLARQADMEAKLNALLKVVTENNYYRRIRTTEEESQAAILQGSVELMKEAIAANSWEMISSLSENWSKDFKKQICANLSQTEMKQIVLIKDAYFKYIKPLEDKLALAREEMLAEIRQQYVDTKQQHVDKESKNNTDYLTPYEGQATAPIIKPQDEIRQKHLGVVKKREDTLSTFPSVGEPSFIKNLPEKEKATHVNNNSSIHTSANSLPVHANLHSHSQVDDWGTPLVVEGKLVVDNFQKTADFDEEVAQARASILPY